MIFHIRNTTTYRYSRPVFIEPHMFRLSPRLDGNQTPLRTTMTVEPAPVLQTKCLDVESNFVTSTWFEGLYDHLTVVAESTVQTVRENPFDFVLDDQTSHLPMHYPADLQPPLEVYRRREAVPDGDPVGKFAAQLLEECGGQTLGFLTLLTARLFDRTNVEVRQYGDPVSADQTLHSASGACRDLAVLFMDAARSVGLAAQFVSGYHEGDPDIPDWYLHAWAAVYLPQAGWRGFDPTLGLVVADRHVAVASGYHPGRAAPITGTFRGEATAELSYDVAIKVRESAGPDTSS